MALSSSFSKRAISLCSQLLSSYDSDRVGAEEHLERFLQSDTCYELVESEQVFLSEVFGGCVHYRPLIKTVLDSYYESREGTGCLHSDANLYFVICYLVMFRLDELGVAHFKRLINSQHIVKMYKFLSFLFSQDNLKGWIKEEWCKIYDTTFVNDKILAPLLQYEPVMLEYIQQLEAKVNYTVTPHYSTKPTTKTVPFSITAPRGRRVPTPEMIPTIPSHKPVPQSTYIAPVESERISQIRGTQKIRAKEKLQEANALQFSCSSTEKSHRTKTVIKEIIEEREARLDYEPIKPAPIPVSMRENRPLKLNTAAILREGARIQKSEEEEEKRLAGLESGQKDDTEFIRRQEEAKERAAAELISEQKRRHLEGKLSYEEAIIAKQNAIQETKERVAQIKDESRRFMEEYFQRREDEKREMRRLVEATMQGHKSTRDSQIKLQQMKSRLVQKMEKEKQELFKTALEEEETEMRRKVELIRQIRTMESVPVLRTKLVDLTESGGQGLLAEMSVAELRERLALMKIAKSEEQERKKREITAARAAKEKLLTETVNAITKHRATAAAAQTNRVKQEKESSLQRNSLADNRELKELQQKLEMRKKERERLKQENIKGTKYGKTALTDTTTGNSTQSPLETLLRATTN